MNARPAVRLLFVSLLALLALTACVTFERAPVAKLNCDPALAGQWRPIKGGPANQVITVAGDCTMRWPEDDGGIYTTTLEGFALGESRYLVFTPAVADRLMAGKGDLVEKAPKNSVYIVRYRIDGERASVILADPDEAARPTAKGKAAGRRLDNSTVHVAGSRASIAKLLRTRGETIFARKQDGSGTMQLQRVATEAAP
jgi:hypothetical protein